MQPLEKIIKIFDFSKKNPTKISKMSFTPCCPNSNYSSPGEVIKKLERDPNESKTGSFCFAFQLYASDSHRKWKYTNEIN